MSYINKVLIANRGEIACRVIRTAKKMGIRTVAVYSDSDKQSLHVQQADEAYHIGPSPALQSYLRSEKIIDVALHAKAQAIHPGYDILMNFFSRFGFLSENAGFAEDCARNDLAFVGPPPEAIRKMGSKSESKIIMTNANVPVVPGYHGETQTKEFLLDQAQKIGFPVLIKAVMGGGGKGMRVVHHESEFEAALESAQRESLKSFKDDRVLVEKYIQLPRHIEVQVFGDMHGNYVHFFERDCSIQRRHQKVIEEAPSALEESLRQDIGQKAILAAKAVKYHNAGTVEFIFDLATSQYYFMEMNTRLQVEHPITEMITQTDLVEWQFRVAMGEKLPKTQSEIKKHGWAIEARVYSESPRSGFLPGSGHLSYYREPQNEENRVRVESGVRENDEISIHYDPMIAKLVVWGENRQQAILRLDKSLQNYKIVGLPNNIQFLKSILKHPEYLSQDYDTSFIPKNQVCELLLKKKEVYNRVDIVAAIIFSHEQKSSKQNFPKELKNFRNSFNLTQTYTLSVQSENYAEQLNNLTVNLTCKHNGYQVQLGENSYNISLQKRNDQKWAISTQEGTVEREFYIDNKNNIHLFDQDGDHLSVTITSDIVKGDESHETHHEHHNTIKAPMPCTLTRVQVKVGDKVKKGDILLVMEAMKMEHTVKASKDGVVKEIHGKIGEFVEHGKVILVME